MPFVPVANTALAEMRMTWDGQQVENTLYFEFPSAPSVADLTALAGDLISWWEAFYSTQVFIGVQLREVVCTDLTSATGPQVSLAPVIDAFGDLNEQSLPNNVTLTVSFRTANRGRSFRGRNYFVGLCEPQVTNSTVGASTIAAIVDIYQELRESPIADLATWVVVSRFSGVDPVTGQPIPRVAGVTTPVLSVVVVDSIVDSQRRRLPGRGN